MSEKEKSGTPGKDLVVKNKTSQPVVMSVTNAKLEKLQKKFAKIPDCTTTEGYELARVGISEIVGLRTGLAACKKDLKAEAIAFGKKVDTEYNRVLDILVGIETPMKEAKSKVDAIKEAKKEKKRKSEENRKFKITNRINMIREIIFSVIDKTSEEIKKQLDVVKEIEISKNDFEEFTTEAERARIDAEVKLEELYGKAVEREEAEVERKAEEDRIAGERKKLEEEKAVADAETERLRKIDDNIDRIKELPFAYHGRDSSDIELGIQALETMIINEVEFSEFIDNAASAKVDALDKLKTLKTQAEEREALSIKTEVDKEIGLIREIVFNNHDRYSWEIEADIKSLEAREISEVHVKFKDAIETAKKESLEKLRTLKDNSIKAEATVKEADEKRIADEKEELDKAAKAKEAEDEELQLDKYNESLAAIDSLVGDKKISKAVLDAAVDGSIPNVTYA